VRTKLDKTDCFWCKEEGLRDELRIVVGGGAVTDAYAEEIEADGYGQNAELGVRITKLLLGHE
jgi:methanogenic corrinoid protein MtbC1